ncbi:MAG: hypothetical protein KDA92_20585 [Planctomycetales bacterium]|nr:hypothetical protein [Planctomycetales bacterium]
MVGKLLKTCCVALAIGSLLSHAANAVTVRSLDSIQYGGDISIERLPEGRTYTALRNWIIAAGGEILPGTNTPTQSDLEDVDLFFFGRVKQDADYQVSAATKSALRTFVELGGTLLIETEADVDSVRAANDVLDGLGLGRPVTTAGFGWGQAGPNAGKFTDQVGTLTVSTSIDLRNQTYGSTQTAAISTTLVTQLGGTVLGTNSGFNSIVEFTPFPTGGAVVFLGNPLMTDLFNRANEAYYSESNLLAFGNLFSSIDSSHSVRRRCDLNLDMQCDALDIDLLSEHIRQAQYIVDQDLDDDGQLTEADREVWVVDLQHTYFGDANLDGLFDSSDLVAVFAQGEYEDGLDENSGWADGDWDGDGDFSTSDLVVAFAGGGYDQGARASVVFVPEPNIAPVILLLGLLVQRRSIAN